MYRFYFVAVAAFLLLSTSTFAIKKAGIFSGRVSKLNEQASLMRVRVDFANMKYLNKKDKVFFWNENSAALQCKAYIVGKTSDYLLMKIPDYKFCKRRMHIAPAGHLYFSSQDLVNNLKMGKELIEILVKKRLAVHGKLTENQKELERYVEKLAAISKRYDVLREKLEAEWRDEIALVEEDRTTSYRNYKDLERRRDEVDQKLEKYRVHDENLKEDRWALDSRLYFKK